MNPPDERRFLVLFDHGCAVQLSRSNSIRRTCGASARFILERAALPSVPGRYAEAELAKPPDPNDLLSLMTKPPATPPPQPADEPPFDVRLGGYRERIDALDEQLVDLLRQRLRVVEEVVALKKAHHQPIYHPAREEDLISRRRGQAEAAGLSPEFIEDVFRRMLRESRVVQSEQMVGHSIRPGTRVVLVGGSGEMGRCLRRWLEAGSYDVRILERGDWAEATAICEGAELAILSVPINATEGVAHMLAPHLPANCVLADITSIKAGPLRAMMAAHRGPVVGLHPMFGPTTQSLDKQIVVVTPGRDPEASRWFIDQMAAWGAVIMEASPDEHDEAMAIVQALRHFATFCFGQFLHRRHVDLRQTLDFSSPIYRLELAMVGRLFAQDPHLYAEIIFATPERRALLKDYMASVASNLPMIVDGDKAGFTVQFREIAQLFGPFAGQAIRESSYLIEKLIERF